MSKMQTPADQVPSGSDTIDNIGVVDIDNQDLDEAFPELGDGKDGEDGKKKPDGDGDGTKKDGDDKSAAKPDDKKGDKGDGDDGDKDKLPADGETPVKYQGKSAKELLAILTEKEKLGGRQSEEVGAMRKQLADLAAENERLKSGKGGDKPSAAAPGAPVDQYQTQVAQLESDLETGKITPTEYAKQLAQLGEQRTAQIVQGELEKSQRVAAEQVATNQFLEMNPDFKDMQANGVLDKIKAQFPVHDNVSAYEFAKRLQLQAENEDLKAQLLTIKKEQADAIAKGADGTKKVLQQPGVGAKVAAPQKTRRGFSETAAVDSMLGAMQRTRES